MSRSGYSDDNCGNEINLYRANVARSIRGKKGQSFLRELAVEMDAMLVKELVAEDLVLEDGSCCAIGVVCKSRKIDVSKVDETNPSSVGDAVGISRCLAAEIEYENDECGPWNTVESPADRWQRMRKWVEDQLQSPTSPA